MMVRTTYEILLSGPLPPELADEFADMAHAETPAETVLVTEAIDQSELEKLIARIRDLGLELRELRRAPDPEQPPEG
jgi:hypothetical protein